MSGRQASEDVIINAPMSYVGSAQRIWRLRRHAHAVWAKLVVTVLAIALILPAWLFITGWYVVFSVLLVPYRILRRGARKRKAEALRHRELLEAVREQR